MRVVIRISRFRQTAGPSSTPEATAAPKPELRAVWCSGCGSRYVKLSRSRGLLDVAWAAFGYSAFRCLSCGRRFHSRTSAD